jgi:hypothetical protein
MPTYPMYQATGVRVLPIRLETLMEQEKEPAVRRA